MAIVFIICGLRLFPQTNDSTYYRAQGWQYRVSLIKMIEADNFKVERDSLLSVVDYFKDRIKNSDNQLKIKDNKILSLHELLRNSKEQYNVNEDKHKVIVKDLKRKNRKALIIGIPIAFTLGVAFALILL